MSNDEHSFPIMTRIGKAAVLEQLAEESVELAKAALKLARIERHENPTPVKYGEAFSALLEEIADVRVCVDVLACRVGSIDTTDIELAKIRRWQERIKAYYDPAPELAEGLHGSETPAD